MPVEGASLPGQLTIPTGAGAVVLFAHGAGSNHLSERNRFMARVLNQHGFGTLLFDLLTKMEDVDYPNRFNIPLLTDRLLAATATSIRRWQRLSGYLAISGRVRGRPRRCGQRPGCLGVFCRGFARGGVPIGKVVAP